MKHDGVSHAFDIILEEIEAVESEISSEGAYAFRERHYDRADALSDSGKKLLKFREKLEKLREEWKSEIDSQTRNRIKVDPACKISPHSKGPKTAIRVTMPNGRVIQRSTAAETFTEVIDEIGFEAVRKLGLSVSGVPLVDTKQNSKYSQIKRGSYYVITHSNTKTKKDIIEQISKIIGTYIKVEVV